MKSPRGCQVGPILRHTALKQPAAREAIRWNAWALGSSPSAPRAIMIGAVMLAVGVEAVPHQTESASIAGSVSSTSATAVCGRRWRT
mmetsp:Transcript_134882/g.234486  ORF Transcript_134882/g.234486 Transcript_134882/m.234486 type:complete len:87 (-) Transcript_134882:1454-1714(-)